MQDYWAAMFEGFSWDKEKLAGATAAIREDGGPAAIQRRGPRHLPGSILPACPCP